MEIKLLNGCIAKLLKNFPKFPPSNITVQQYNNVNPQKGFTLIELMVVISIMALMIFGGITAYTSFERREILDNAYKELQTTLALARQRANSGEKPDTCKPPNDRPLAGHGLRIFFTGSRPVFEFRAICQNSDGSLFNASLSETRDGPSGVEITGWPTTIDPYPVGTGVVFLPLGQGTNLSSPVTITFTHLSSNETFQATLDTRGNLEKQ